MRILIDIDETLCNNMGEWLAIYNEKSGDALVPEDIKLWNIESYLKPDYVEYFWSVAYPGSFKLAEPFLGAVSTIEKVIKSGHEVLYVTAGVCVEKMKWMWDYGFTKGSHHLAPKNIVITYKKELVIGDVLIDDGLHNFSTRKYNILFDQPWNREETSFPIARARNWQDVNEYLEMIGALEMF